MYPSIGCASIGHMSLEIDHIVFCVRDLQAAADALRSSHGLTARRGGRHPGHGTENQIVPLGSSYLELVGVVDSREAAASSFGSWVEDHADDELMPHALCLRSDDLDGLCASLGLRASPMSRTRPDGVELHWRFAGLEETISRGMPFYIEWQVQAEHHPGWLSEAGVTQPADVEVWLEGDRALLESRTAGAPGVHIGAGPTAVSRVSIRIAGRESVFGRSIGEGDSL